MSDLVGSPPKRFYRDTAQISALYYEEERSTVKERDFKSMSRVTTKPVFGFPGCTATEDGKRF